MSDWSGPSPLDITLSKVYKKKDFFEVANYLVKHGCHSDDLEVKLLCGACRWGNLEMVKELAGQLKVKPNGELLSYSKVYAHNSAVSICNCS